MKYRYIVWDEFGGRFCGTNETTTATAYACSDDFAVYDTERGFWLCDGEEFDVEPLENTND